MTHARRMIRSTTAHCRRLPPRCPRSVSSINTPPGISPQRGSDRDCRLRRRFGLQPDEAGLLSRGAEAVSKSGVAPPGGSTLIAVAETSYASCGDLSLAYQVFGDGPVELVFTGPFVTHVELFWTVPEYKAFFDHLATFCRIVLFDKAGVGLSDPVPHVRTLEGRATEIEAVMDAVGFGRAAVMGGSDGGPAAMMFAAARPE